MGGGRKAEEEDEEVWKILNTQSQIARDRETRWRKWRLEQTKKKTRENTKKTWDMIVVVWVGILLGLVFR